MPSSGRLPRFPATHTSSPVPYGQPPRSAGSSSPCTPPTSSHRRLSSSSFTTSPTPAPDTSLHITAFVSTAHRAPHGISTGAPHRRLRISLLHLGSSDSRLYHLLPRSTSLSSSPSFLFDGLRGSIRFKPKPLHPQPSPPPPAAGNHCNNAPYPLAVGFSFSLSHSARILHSRLRRLAPTKLTRFPWPRPRRLTYPVAMLALVKAI